MATVTITEKMHNTPDDKLPFVAAIIASGPLLIASERIIPKVLKAKHVTAKKGGQILRASQVAAFVIPVSAATAFTALNDGQPTSTNEQEINPIITALTLNHDR